MSSILLAQKYIEEFRVDPTWKIDSFIERVKKDMKYTITKIMAWRARDHALKAINGDEKEQYGLLHAYIKEVLKTNPGSIVKFKEPKGPFPRMYVCMMD